ncbi:membrane protease YdiL (CAAX protease family) [Saccharomonospora amisosensis]|uniref:Membrane protease YdiL (CAAX protease family) n=1 Tax=Saccharomonospora amisosensis TaxID=1128677 RepID=A0A7X5UNG4_9PSEU|nr:CPBP family intramembrane glutamic endopeptidase [Saccharomonospora amisosensis]NIJ11251.1 membrane protease YdiL (CAAX protease family) [Saccharomonospora amisosensis]
MPTTDVGLTTASRVSVFTRATFAAVAMAVGLGTAGAVGDVVHTRLGIDGFALRLSVALTCFVITVPLVVLLRTRVDRRSLAGLGLGTRHAVRAFASGVLITVAAAATTFAVGTGLGWLHWGAVEWPTLVTFLLANTLVALLLEAVPEELAFRGYGYRTLNARLRKWTASLATTGLFLLTPAAASAVQALVNSLLGGPVRPLTFAPPGEDPVSYAILLAVFGFTLLVARIATGSLWTCVALHLTFLTVNRMTLLGDARNAGWSAQLNTPDAVLLVPAYLLLTALAFVVLARVRGHRLGWRDRGPEPAGTDTIRAR